LSGEILTVPAFEGVFVIIKVYPISSGNLHPPFSHIFPSAQSIGGPYIPSSLQILYLLLPSQALSLGVHSSAAPVIL